MALIGLLDEAQVEAYMFSILSSWTMNDGNLIRFGSGINAQLGWDAGYMQGPNPYTGLWQNAPSLSYSDPSVTQILDLQFHQIDIDDDWTQIDNAGAGMAVATLQDEEGGVIAFTCGSPLASYIEYLWQTNNWQINGAEALWWETRFQTDDETDLDFFIGLVDRNTTDVFADLFDTDADLDGLYFMKRDGGTVLQLESHNGINGSNIQIIDTYAANTWYRIGFFWDGSDIIYPYIDGVFSGSTIKVSTDIVPGGLLAFAFGIRTGEVANKTMKIDYIRSIQLRS